MGESSRASLEASQSPAAADGVHEPKRGQRRVLLVDDEADLLDVMTEELHSAGLDVTAANSGSAAIEAARRAHFDVAITDLMMPGLDGLQTAAALKKIDPRLPIVVATGYASEAARLAFGPEGILAGLLLKPFRLDQMLAAIELALPRPPEAPEHGH